jgi:two-component system response regulator LytT
MTLNCIAIDDEPPALDLICMFIRQTPFLNLIGSFSNGIESLQFISENPVDLLFLDIQMPDLSGVELAKILSGRNVNGRPAIIFTTAFDQFALEGYKLEAADYLLKPFSYEDFLRGANKPFKWAQIKKSVEGHLKEEAFIYLKVGFQTVKISCNNIMYIEGLKDYAKIYLANTEKSVLSLITLKSLEEKLPKGKFMRIHRSFIVALDKISSITKKSVFIGKSMCPISNQFREEFNKFIGDWQ